jgi:hypothetical protein
LRDLPPVVNKRIIVNALNDADSCPKAGQASHADQVAV